MNYKIYSYRSIFSPKFLLPEFRKKNNLRYITNLLKPEFVEPNKFLYKPINSLVLLNCNPLGKNKKDAQHKDVVTIMTSPDMLKLNCPAVEIYGESVCRANLFRVFTDHIKDELFYGFTIIARVNKHNSFIYSSGIKRFNKDFITTNFSLLLNAITCRVDYFVTQNKNKL